MYFSDDEDRKGERSVSRHTQLRVYIIIYVIYIHYILHGLKRTIRVKTTTHTHTQ